MENWKDYDKQENTRIHLFNVKKKLIRYPNKEGLKMLHSLNSNFVRTYPKNCNTEASKFKYLASLVIENHLEPKVFVELADVLKFKPKVLEKKMSEVIGIKILNQIREDEIKW